MRTTLTIDDDLWATAVELTWIRERSAIVRRAFETLVAVEAGRRLARLGGSDPDARAPARDRLDR